MQPVKPSCISISQ